MSDFQRVEIIWSHGSSAPPVQGMTTVYCLKETAAPEGPMGAVEQSKTLCCLGRKSESAMIAFALLLHEIIRTAGRVSGWASPMQRSAAPTAEIRTESHAAIPHSRLKPTRRLRFIRAYRMTSRAHVTSQLAPCNARVA